MEREEGRKQWFRRGATQQTQKNRDAKRKTGERKMQKT